MTAATPTSERLPGLPDRFYAPDFRIEVEGRAIEPSLRANITEVAVTLDSEQLSGADLTINNQDTDINRLMEWLDSDVFRLGNRVRVHLGYAEPLVLTLTGPITTLSPQFPSGGAPAMTMHVADPLVVLQGSRPPKSDFPYRDKQDWQIAQDVADRHHLRFEHDSNDGPVHRLVVQSNKDDLQFLKERAARIDRQVFMRPDEKTGENVLHFGTPTDERGGEPIRTWLMAWGSQPQTPDPPPPGDGTTTPPQSAGAPSKPPSAIPTNMIDFRPTISASEQVQSVTVRGWDVETKSPINHTAFAAETPGVIGDDEDTGPAAALAVAGEGGRHEVIIKAPVTTQQEAEQLAESVLAERAAKVIKATGTAIGQPAMRPGDNLEIHGVGRRFGGTYYVTKVTHTLNASGLLTAFTARKTYQGTRP